MLNKKRFDRSILSQGPIKLYTREEMKRSQVTSKPTQVRTLPAALIPMPTAQVEIPRDAFEVGTSLILDHNLLLARNYGNSFEGVGTAPGGGGGE